MVDKVSNLMWCEDLQVLWREDPNNQGDRRGDRNKGLRVKSDEVLSPELQRT